MTIERAVRQQTVRLFGLVFATVGLLDAVLFALLRVVEFGPPPIDIGFHTPSVLADHGEPDARGWVPPPGEVRPPVESRLRRPGDARAAASNPRVCNFVGNPIAGRGCLGRSRDFGTTFARPRFPRTRWLSGCSRRRRIV